MAVEILIPESGDITDYRTLDGDDWVAWTYDMATEDGKIKRCKIQILAQPEEDPHEIREVYGLQPLSDADMAAWLLE